MIKNNNAYSEVYVILTKLNLFSSLPEHAKDNLLKGINPNYKFDFNANISLSEQKLDANTEALLSYIYIKYLCKDKEEKKFLISKYEENEKIYQQKLKEKYNSDNIFSNSQKKQKENSYNQEIKNQEIVVYKETILQKIRNVLLKIFKKC